MRRYVIYLVILALIVIILGLINGTVKIWEWNTFSQFIFGLAGLIIVFNIGENEL